MKIKSKIKKIIVASLFMSIAGAASAQIVNPGFEDRFDGWRVSDPDNVISISNITNSGTRSGRIRAGGGRISQDVTLDANSTYRLTAQLRGGGRLNAQVGNVRATDRASTGENYAPLSIEFDTDSSGEVEIFMEFSGSEGRWDDLSLVRITGDSSGGGSSGGGSSTSGDFGLNPNLEPWENFDLSEWRLDTPASRSSSSSDRCRSQVTDPEQYGNSDFDREDSEEYFFTHTDGGMRFVTEVGQATTGNNCDSRTRSELREMLRGSNRNIDDTGDSGDFRNNWALGYQPNSADADFTWGARGGRMEATLRVNQVTTQGDSSNIGRTVIGQIHASEDEPLRLNYKHREGFEGGCIYASSEQRGGGDTNFVLVGDGTSCNDDPGSDGIGLGELFSYVIENVDEFIFVTIIRGDRDGEVINRMTIDLNEINAGYDRDDEWNYFKAGAYTQNDRNSGARNGDSDIVTFYRLNVTH